MVRTETPKESSPPSSEIPLTENRRKSLKLAHDLDKIDILRTQDILTTDDVEFKNLLLPEFILRGLTAANFYRPSPIQLRSIPLLRLGLDLIVQSKAGTGKTLVITLAVLETVNLKSKRLQVIAVAPTREIALQTKHFISIVSADIAVRTEVFIGGTSVKEDKKNLLGCQVAIGTPGRLNSLIESGDMSLCHVKLFVLDEADKLMEKSIFSQVKSISKLLPASKQTILCSATFLQPVKEYVVKHMKEPFWVTPERASRLQPGNFDQQKSSQTVLLGVTQFFKEVPNHSQIVRKLKFKLEEILEILSGHSFTQCIIFSNYQTRAETICHQLVSNGWPAISVRGQDEQSHRTATLTSFKEFQSRVLLTTDVMSRGVDFRGVDLVINLDIPYDSATYLHRMGRAGRFGSYGCVITLASKGEEVEAFRKILSEINDATVYALPSDLSLIKKDGQFLDIVFGPSLSVLDNPSENNGEVNEPHSPDGVGPEVQKTDSSTNVEKVEMKTEVQNLIEINAESAETKSLSNLKEGNPGREIPKSSSESTQNVVVEGYCLKTVGQHGPKAIECDSRKDEAIQQASAQLNEVLCMSKPNVNVGLRSLEELEENYTHWIAGNNKDYSREVTSLTNELKIPDWWASANLVLTAAKLQLQELKESSVSRSNLNELVGNYSSDSSEERGSERVQEKITKKVCGKKEKKLKGGSYHKKSKSKADTHCSGLSSQNNRETLELQGSTWLWDESSKLYYLWDSSLSVYHLYNPELECYFKWEPGTDRYFKWDNLLQEYRLWDCASNCYCGTKETTSKEAKSKFLSANSNKNTESTGHVYNQNYVQWFSLWNKHLRQMSWQVYQVEYLNNLCHKFHNL